MTPHIPDLIRQAFALKPAKLWPSSSGGEVDRSKVLNASEIGRCVRAIGYAKHCADELVDEWSDLTRCGYAERGHAVEAWVNSILDLHNEHNDDLCEFFRYGAGQRSVTDGKLSATPDAIMLTDDDLFVVDIKSIDPRTNTAFLPKHEHVRQVQAAAYLVRKEQDERGPRRNVAGSILLYVDASNFNKMHQHFVPYDPNFAEWAYERHSLVFDNDPSELALEGISTGECKLCPWTKRCNADFDRSRESAFAEMAERAMKDVFGTQNSRDG